MGDNLVDILVPIALFGSIFGIVAVITYYRFRSQQEMQETVRKLLESGQQLSEQKLGELVAVFSPHRQDLRRGMISIAVAIAFALFAVALGERDAMGPLLGIAAFPLMIGVAYLFLYYSANRQPAD